MSGLATGSAALPRLGVRITQFKEEERDHVVGRGMRLSLRMQRLVPANFVKNLRQPPLVQSWQKRLTNAPGPAIDHQKHTTSAGAQERGGDSEVAP